MTEETQEATTTPADGRAKAARARREAADRPPPRPTSKAEINERLLAQTMAQPEIAAAFRAADDAQAKRDSVSRKLCGGSHAVTAQDLARCETALANATKQLVQLAQQHPVLWMHPRLAVMPGAAELSGSAAK